MIVEKAYLGMYPEGKLGKYDFSIKYSGRFNSYNGNVSRRGRAIQFNLSKEWKNIGEEVQIGLIQELFNKILKTKVRTQNMELYEIFLKKIHIAVPKTKTDEELVASFNRVNEKYFFGLIELPNLVWGTRSTRKLGSYEYGSDTISISQILKDNTELLDYVMYHEMLHKKHKFNSKNGKSYHHTKEFHKDERKFEDQKEIEKKLGFLVTKSRVKKRISSFFS